MSRSDMIALMDSKRVALMDIWLHLHRMGDYHICPRTPVQSSFCEWWKSNEWLMLLVCIFTCFNSIYTYPIIANYSGPLTEAGKILKSKLSLKMKMQFKDESGLNFFSDSFWLFICQIVRTISITCAIYSLSNFHCAKQRWIEATTISTDGRMAAI